MNKKMIKTIASITCGLGIVGLISTTSTSCNNHSWPKNAIPKEYLNISNGILHGFKDTFIPSEHINDGYDTLSIPKDVITIAQSAFDFEDHTQLPSFVRNIMFEDNSKINSIEHYAFDFGSYTPDKIVLPEGLTHMDSFYSYSYGMSTIVFPSTLNEIPNHFLFDGENSWISNIIFNNIDLSNNHNWLKKISSETFSSDSLISQGTIRVSGKSNSSSEEVLNYLIEHTKDPQTQESPFRLWTAL